VLSKLDGALQSLKGCCGSRIAEIDSLHARQCCTAVEHPSTRPWQTLLKHMCVQANIMKLSDGAFLKVCSNPKPYPSTGRSVLFLRRTLPLVLQLKKRTPSTRGTRPDATIFGTTSSVFRTRSLTDGGGGQEFRAVAKEYPQIKSEEMIVDNCCMQLTGTLLGLYI